MLKYAKAIAAGLVAAATAFGTFSVDGSVSGQDWLGIIVAALAGAGVVWGVPNKQAA
jgi:hypothetical protein